MGRPTSRPIVIRNDIRRDRVLRRGHAYLITRQVHVRSGARLTVEDGARVGLLNGAVPGSTLARASLVFDAGSELKAGRWQVCAVAPDGRPALAADNGGLWFLGTHRDASKDGIRVRAGRSHRKSLFIAQELTVSHLGRGDMPRPEVSQRLQPDLCQEDLDAVSLMGVGPLEWRVRELVSEGAGDDGIDLENSQVRLQRLSVLRPGEDGINLSSSSLEVTHSLNVTMGQQGEGPGIDPDRDIVDLEVDRSPSQLLVHAGSQLHCDGVLGDQLQLDSLDLPPHREEGRTRYVFSDRLIKGPARLHATDED